MSKSNQNFPWALNCKEFNIENIIKNHSAGYFGGKES